MTQKTAPPPNPRRWFWVLTALLCVNAVLALGYHFLGWNPATDAKADLPALQIAPQSIAMAPASAAAETTFAPPAPSNLPSAASTQCWVWGAFADAQAQTLNAKAQSAGLPAAQSLATPITATHIIVMGPYPNRAALDKKMAELKRMKVSDFAATENLSISLGIFSSESAAQNQFKTLGKLGVRSAKVLQKETQVAKTSLRFDALQAPQSALLKALATDLGSLDPCL